MRRMVLLFGGLGIGMSLMWLLLQNAGAELAGLSAPETVLCVAPALQEDVSSTDMEQTVLTLPYQIPGTTLTAERIAAYEGPYLEDCTGDEVVNVAALVLRNTGQAGVESAQVILYWGDEQYIFEADTIPAGQSVLVLEKSRSAYAHRSYTDCIGWQTQAEGDWTAYKYLTVEEVGQGTLAVTNISDSELTNIHLYYKSYLSPPGIYVGGITYKVRIRKLEPGQTLQINPPYYARGYSRVARVTLE